MDYVGPGIIILDPNLNTVTTLTGLRGNVLFDPSRDWLFVAETDSNRIIVFDSTNWERLGELSTGENLGSTSSFGSGVMALSSDGRKLFLSTPTGVRIITVPGAITHFSVTASDIPSVDKPATFTVTALDNNNDTALGYTGSVQFTSSDPAAILPAMRDPDGRGWNVFSDLQDDGPADFVRDGQYHEFDHRSKQRAIGTGAGHAISLSGVPNPASPGVSFTVTVSALDALDHVAVGYTGTVHITSGDGQALLPADFTLANGTSTFTVTLKTAGSQSLTALIHLPVLSPQLLRFP